MTIPILPTPEAAEPAAGDPCYLILCGWSVPGRAAAGDMMIDQYRPRLHNRPSPLSPAHTPHIIQTVKETLAQQGLIGAQVMVKFIWRYEVQPSAIIDLTAGRLN